MKWSKQAMIGVCLGKKKFWHVLAPKPQKSTWIRCAHIALTSRWKVHISFCQHRIQHQNIRCVYNTNEPFCNHFGQKSGAELFANTAWYILCSIFLKHPRTHPMILSWKFPVLSNMWTPNMDYLYPPTRLLYYPNLGAFSFFSPPFAIKNFIRLYDGLKFISRVSMLFDKLP